MSVSSRRLPVLLEGLLLATMPLAGSGVTQPPPTRQAQALWDGDAPAVHRTGAPPPGGAAADRERLMG